MNRESVVRKARNVNASSTTKSRLRVSQAFGLGRFEFIHLDLFISQVLLPDSFFILDSFR